MSREDWADWVNVPYTIAVTGEERRAKDERLTGIRLPLSEDDWRRLAARELEPLKAGGYYGNFMRVMRNTLTLFARTRVQDLDAVTAWESEGGR